MGLVLVLVVSYCIRLFIRVILTRSGGSEQEEGNKTHISTSTVLVERHSFNCSEGTIGAEAN